MDKEEGKIFFELLSKKREEKNVSLGDVCQGLCTPREMAYMERGERFPDRLLQDRLLARLGVNADDYEYFLDYSEYGQWRTRQRILHNITHDNMEKAKRLLEQYESKCAKKRALEQQFCLDMRFQIRYREKAPEQELFKLCLEAARLTIPNPEERDAGQRVLALQEINLLLELERYRPEGENPEMYLSLMENLEKQGFDDESRARLYPKIVYFMCRCRIDRQKPDDSEALEELRYCNRAIELLRNCGKLYYFWELLTIREELLCRLKNQVPQLEQLQKENTEWKSILEKLYEEYGVPRETFHDCYLYVVKYVQCINDVIRIRRRMLGICPKELCDGICDVKTLRRLERRQTVPQRAIVVQLLNRLGLSGEHRRTEIVTEKPEVNQMVRKLRNSINAFKYEAADQYLEFIKKEVSLEIKCNQQMLLMEEASAAKRRGILKDGDYLLQLRIALELTLPYEAFLQEGEKYLTLEEQTCIRNMMRVMDKESKEFLICMQRFEEIYQPYTENEELEAFFGAFEFIMCFIGSERGNRREFDRADAYSHVIAEESLRFRKSRAISDAIYDQWWNYNERKKSGLPVDQKLDGKEELKKCIILSKMVKNKRDELFFQKELVKKLETQGNKG